MAKLGKATILSPAAEDYVKTIYELESAQANVTTTALAHAMNVSPASATNMMKRLARLELLRYSRYHGVRLTRTGKKVALEIVRHHRLIELFLNEALGISWDKGHDEANRLEHVLSENLEDRIANYLGNPTVDAHGDPIPSKNGSI